MKRTLELRIQRLPEGVYLATAEDTPGLVAQGRTIAETVAIAADVRKKLLEASAAHDRTGPPGGPGDHPPAW